MTMPSTYLAVVLLFLLPVAMLVGGILIGRTFFDDELAAFGLGAAFLIVGFGGARAFESYARRRGRYKTTVVSLHAPVGAADD